MSDDDDSTENLPSEQSGSGNDEDFAIKKRKVGNEVPRHKITVNFSSSGPISHEPVTYVLKSTTPLSKMFEAFAANCGEDLTNMRFYYHRERVQESDTAQSLQLDIHEDFDAVVPQQGG